MAKIDAREQLRLQCERLKRGQSPTKKSIDEMDLDELLPMEARYLAWYPTHPDHHERDIKKHIYETYIKPRIALLKEDAEQIANVEQYLLGEQPPAGSQIPLSQESALVQNTNN